MATIFYIVTNIYNLAPQIKLQKKGNPFHLNNNNMLSKEIIINLIKDDLINTRLVYGLENLGLNAGNYYLHLNETIFQLIGIEEDKDEFFDKYIEECRTVEKIDIFNHPDLLDNMALQLYDKLQKEYKAQKHEK
ncbi:MAG: hypothetical protein WAQ28_09070 [Bacteroidia bacterium]